MAFSKPTQNKRILREIQEMKQDPPCNISAGPVGDQDVNNWKATIIGPPGTPYEGGIFELSINLPANYPFCPPKVTFNSPIFHCNIKGTSICLDILKNEWSPALTIGKVLLSISSLLAEPNPDDPLDSEAANLYKNNRKEYDRKARNQVKRNQAKQDML